MLIPFNNLLFYKNKISGIIHIGAHELEELPAYLKQRVKDIIWIEANPEKYNLIENIINKHPYMFLGKFAAGSKKDKLFLQVQLEKYKDGHWRIMLVLWTTLFNMTALYFFGFFIS